eukprot:GHVU01004691.1.p1 GENE.GHVU01004691.1~~GHVU01004691.1.p1  ORF type:complete len:142 (-),score=4.09 GHVU01004691.1:185-610(-)
MFLCLLTHLCATFLLGSRRPKVDSRPSASVHMSPTRVATNYLFTESIINHSTNQTPNHFTEARHWGGRKNLASTPSSLLLSSPLLSTSTTSPSGSAETVRHRALSSLPQPVNQSVSVAPLQESPSRLYWPTPTPASAPYTG